MPMTCITCHVAFTCTTLQRDHYKSDWHRYNLMRKVAELPPVTAEEFDQRALLHKSDLQEQTQGYHCQNCSKYFSSKNSYENHLKSKKHSDSVNNCPIEINEALAGLSAVVLEKNRKNAEKSLEARIEAQLMADLENSDDSDWESVAEGSYDVEFCLFCNLESEDLESNVKHMSEDHSFFLPDIEFLTDLRGLVAYLGCKTVDLFTCLWCNKTFHSAEAVQKHTIDKGHSKMLHEGEALLEYEEFYDYTSSYPDEEAEDVPDMNLEGDDWQLVLPSGATVGHRSLSRYYRQNLRPERNGSRPKPQKTISRLMGEYRSLGWRETPERVAQRNARDLRFMRKVLAKQQLRLGQKANRLQPYLRPQVVF